MIKLKSLIGEITLGSGHAGTKDTVVDVGSFVSRLDKLGFDIKPSLYVRGLEGDARARAIGVLPSVELPIEQLKAQAEPVDGQPGLHLWSNQLYDRPFYYLLNFNATVIKDLVIATLEGDRRSLGMGYSPSTAFNLPALEVHWSGVADQFRGKGYGKLIYKAVLEKEGTLYSDTILFKGSYGLWTNYLPSISTWYGGLLPISWIKGEDYSLPIAITTQEAQSKAFAESALSGFIASVRPSTQLRKLGYNLKGLSFTKGEYMVIGLAQDADVASFVLDRDEAANGEPGGDPLNALEAANESDSLIEFLESLERGMDMELTGELYVIDPAKRSTNVQHQLDSHQVAKAKTIVLCFSDATAIVKDLGSKVSLTLI